MEFLYSIRADFELTWPAFVVFMTAIFLDVLLGTAAAWACHTASSAVSRVGMLRKAAMVAVVLGFAVADGIFPTLPLTLPLLGSVRVTLAAGCSIFWILTESQSMAEKAVLLGLPVPKGIRKRLAQVRSAFDGSSDGASSEDGVAPPSG